MQEPNQEFKISTSSGNTLLVKEFGLIPYLDSFNAMSDFAVNRSGESQDQIWILQHPSVYTQGTACTQETLAMSNIPVVKSDRGGQITFHGPGQIVMYPLLRLRQHELGIKKLVDCMEQAIINLLGRYDVVAERVENAPGVYVEGAKISALGLRIKRGTSYHGLSFNVDMDLSPFTNIDPCGYQGLEVTQLSDLVKSVDINMLQKQMLKEFVSLL